MMVPVFRFILAALMSVSLLAIAAAEETPEKPETPETPETPTPKAVPEPEPTPAPFPKPIAPLPPPNATPAEMNAPGTVNPSQYLTPGGLRSPTDVVAPTRPQTISEQERGGLNFDRVNIHPGLAYDLTFTDNSLRTATSKKQDALQEAGPTISMNARPTEQITIDAAYAFLEHTYLFNTAENYDSHSGVCVMQFKNLPVDHLDFALGDSFLETGNTSILETQIIAFTRFYTNNAFGYADYTCDRLKLHARYDFDNLHYYGASAKDQDVRTETGTFDASYRLDETFELFSTYSIIRTFQQAGGTPADPDSQDRHTAEAGFVAKFDKLAFSAAGGYTWSQILYDGLQDDGAVASASVDYKPTSRLEAGAYGAFGISQNGSQGRVIGQSRGLAIQGEGGEPFSYGGYATYRAFEHIRLTANVGRTITTAVRTGVTKDFLFGGTAQLLLNERSSLTGTVFRDLMEGVTQPKTNTNSYNVNFSYQVTRHGTAVFSFTRTDQFNNSVHSTTSTDEARFGFRFVW
jgi:hypothetical protein